MQTVIINYMPIHNSNTILKLFGDRVRSLRVEHSISQESLADLCALDRSYIGGVERGERNLSLNNIIKICHALKVQPSALFEGISYE